jgi:hypothetical protein
VNGVLTADERQLAGRLVGQAVAAGTGTDEFAAVRVLARPGPDLDYPNGVIGNAYHASEWLDCLEAALRASEPLDVDPGLLRAEQRRVRLRSGS